MTLEFPRNPTWFAYRRSKEDHKDVSCELLERCDSNITETNVSL